MPSEYLTSVQQQKHRNEYYVQSRLRVSSLEKCGFWLILILLSGNFVSQNNNIALSIPVGGCGCVGGGEEWITDIYLLIKTSIVVPWGYRTDCRWGKNRRNALPPK